jgi:hypothetical protein
MLASGTIGLLTGDRRSFDHLSFCREEEESVLKPIVRVFAILAVQQ